MKLFPQKDIVLLAIETSCDDTSVSIIKNGIDIATYVESTIKEFRKYGGIVPEIAARGHEGSINNVFNKALAIANVKPSELTHIAYTDHPGLPGSLHIGKIFAKTIATLLDIPLIPIDHMLGHVFSYAINKPEIIKFPFLCLVASGGHTTLYKFNSVTKYSVVNETSDDPIGEALDKIGRNLKLEYPGGVSIDKQYDPDKTNNKTIKHLEPEKNFSFAGIKNHILNQVNEHNMKNIPIDAVLLGSSALKWIVDDVMIKLDYYSQKYKINNIVIGGGVSANSLLRKRLNDNSNWNVFIPELKYTGDNGTMIGFYSYLKLI